MKATVSVFGGRVSFEMEAESQKALFKKLSLVQEVFAADDVCGCCGSQNISYRARFPQGYEYYSLYCTNCHAELHFGQRMEGGGLFVKRKDSQGDLLPNNGWSVYEGNGNGGYSEQAPQETPPMRSQPRQGNGYQQQRQPQPPPPNRRQPLPSEPDGIDDSDVPFRWPRPLAAGSRELGYENVLQVRSLKAA